MRPSDFPLASVIELESKKQIGAETKNVITISPMNLRQRSIHNQIVCIEPLTGLNLPPLHVERGSLA
jgi:hypothetical protein